MEASAISFNRRVATMAVLVVILMIPPRFIVVADSTPGNGNPKQWPQCPMQCDRLCRHDPNPSACVINCLRHCIGKGHKPTNLNFCTTGCMVTSCFVGTPENYTKDAIKTCVKSCSDNCSKPCSP